MLDGLTAAQAQEWEIYNAIEPVGEIRGDVRIGVLASMLYNMISSFGGKKGKRIVSKPADFMPFLGDDLRDTPKEQTSDEMKQTLFGFAGGFKPKEK